MSETEIKKEVELFYDGEVIVADDLLLIDQPLSNLFKISLIDLGFALP